MSIIKQISIPASDPWAIEYVNQLAQDKQLSPTVIRALKFYDKYQHLLEQDGTLPGLIDLIKELQSQISQLSNRLENMQFTTVQEQGSQGIDSNDWLKELEEME